MSKRRVHELAKQLGLDSKKLLSTLKSLDIVVKNHMSSISEDEEQMIIKHYDNSTNKKKDTKAVNEVKSVNEVKPVKNVKPVKDIKAVKEIKPVNWLQI